VIVEGSAIGIRLAAEPGPSVVVGKGHSGTRLLTRFLIENGVFMGADLNISLDSLSWDVRFARPLMASRWWPQWEVARDDPDFAALCARLLNETLPQFTDHGDAYRGGPWGWKGSTLFVMPVTAAMFPATHFVHLVRDGRDVVLSQHGELNLPFVHPVLSGDVRRVVRAMADVPRRGAIDRYRLQVLFGDPSLKAWNGVELNRRGVKAHRYLLQMQSWVHNVTTARKYGEADPSRYLEIRYEDLCADPSTAATAVCDFLGLELQPAARRFLEAHASIDRIGKWRTATLDPAERADFDDALALGRPLLADLGYDVRG
jgi:hypothetical protein